MALLLGLATSFHVLVGGYAFLTVLGWLVLRRKTRLLNLRELGLILLLYLAGSAFAIQAVLDQLLLPIPKGALLPSFIYVFLALPFHLNPLLWGSHSWVNLIAYLLICACSASVIWLNRIDRLTLLDYQGTRILSSLGLQRVYPQKASQAVCPTAASPRIRTTCAAATSRSVV